MIKIVLEGELPDLNQYIKSVANNRYGGGKVKREATESIAWKVKKYRNHKLKTPFFIEFHWYCKNKKKDKDNIAFAKKFILDGLQMGEIIPQDTWNVIDGFSDHFYIDNKKPRIVIIIKKI